MVAATRAGPVRIRHSWNLQHYGVYLDMPVDNYKIGTEGTNQEWTGGL
jgi:hypothetical protein